MPLRPPSRRPPRPVVSPAGRAEYHAVMAEESSAGSTESSWSRPKAAPDGDDGRAEGPQRRGARVIAKEVSAALEGGLSRGADRVGAAVRTGMGGIEHALSDPAQAMAKELLKEADLPEIVAED